MRSVPILPSVFKPERAISNDENPNQTDAIGRYVKNNHLIRVKAKALANDGAEVGNRAVFLRQVIVRSCPALLLANIRDDSPRSRGRSLETGSTGRGQ